jgi:methionine--tRNA ligase beta chain
MHPAHGASPPPPGGMPATDASAVPEGSYLLDVREPNEWRAGHAPGAVHIPMGAVASRSGELPPDRDIYVVCRTGGRSASVTRQLTGMGSRAINVAGGMVRWESAGRPMVSETGAEPFVGWPYKPEISYADFAKADLRIAQIVGAEPIASKPGYVLLSVSLGSEHRQMVAAKGLPDLYPSGDLVGRRVVWLANLGPKKIVGHLSEGMVLSAGDDHALGLVLADQSCALGARVR